MKEQQIKIIVLEPNKKPSVVLVYNQLGTFQQLVDGYIECVRMSGFDIVINEEGKNMGLAPNFMLPYLEDIVVGTALFVGVDYEEGEFKSLTDDQVDFIKSVFPREKPNDSLNVLGKLERGVRFD